MIRTIRKIMGLSAGLGLLAAAGLVALVFFLKEERILLMVPGLARTVTVEELAGEPKPHLGRWVRVRGRVLVLRGQEAVLIPEDKDRSGPGVAALKRHLVQGSSLRDAWIGRREAAEAAVPSLYLHEIPALGLRTVSWQRVREDALFTFVGEVETFDSGGGHPHLDAVGSVLPRQGAATATVAVIALGVAAVALLALFLLAGSLRR